MNKFVIADTHIGHKNCIGFDNRPYKTIQEHDEAIVENWNSVVGGGDEVYHIGDVTYRCGKERVKEILDSLNGKIHLIKGNHEYEALRYAKNRFSSIQDYLEIKHNGTLVCMFHYPILEWNKCHRGAIHLHGHVHQNLQEKESEYYKYRVFDMGCMGWNYTPVNLEKIINLSKTKKNKTHGD